MAQMKQLCSKNINLNEITFEISEKECFYNHQESLKQFYETYYVQHYSRRV